MKLATEFFQKAKYLVREELAAQLVREMMKEAGHGLDGKKCNQEKCLKLIKLGADLDYTWNGKTLMMYAVSYDLEKVADALFEKKVPLNQRDMIGSGYTELCWAATYGRTNMARKLVRAGADASIVTNDGTATEIARGMGFDKTAEVIEVESAQVQQQAQRLKMPKV